MMYADLRFVARDEMLAEIVEEFMAEMRRGIGSING